MEILTYQKHTTYIFILGSFKEPYEVTYEDSQYGSPIASQKVLAKAVELMERFCCKTHRVFFLDNMQQYEDNPRPRYWEGSQYRDVVYWLEGLKIQERREIFENSRKDK